jgi:hypothetical protein
MDWTGNRFLGISLAWDYDARIMTMSMAEFVTKALKCYGYDFSKGKRYSPGGYVKPDYGAFQQLVKDDDTPQLGLTDI